jgi:hypothetical protein
MALVVTVVNYFPTSIAHLCVKLHPDVKMIHWVHHNVLLSILFYVHFLYHQYFLIC